jgi:hypothetical protein
MVKCNNNYVCEDDAVTYDEITDESKCVAIADNVCTTCDTVLGIRHSNPRKFNEDPIYSVFARKSNEEETESFWDTLDETCDIKRPETHGQNVDPDFYVIEPDYDDVERSTVTSLDRIVKLKLTDTNATKFLQTVRKIANTPRTAKHILEKDTDGSAYMAYLRDLLESDECSSKLIHHANEIPIGISLFLNKLASSKKTVFSKVIQFLNTKPSACLEAVLEECNNILSRDTKSFTRRTSSRLKKKSFTRRRRHTFTRRTSSRHKRKSSTERRHTY